ncbi:hypothetical protein GW17_00056271 [Ensete ventricosum]|nr:hypothetical protein GW17_00056271 [Ensete ventricosum]
MATGLVSIRGRSLASSSTSSSLSVVLRLMQEQRSREAKNAEETLAPTQFTTRSSLSQDRKLELSIAIGETEIEKKRIEDCFPFRLLRVEP